MGMQGVEVKSPTYQAAEGQGILALFDDGERLPVESSRRRVYPGLESPAPDTSAIYDQLTELFGASERVLDMGCGSGIGLARLVRHFEQVAGVDSDSGAVRFARKLVAGVEVRHEELSSGQLAEDYDVVALIDVLGHIESPAELVRKARQCVKPEGRVFLAEPRAYPSQALVPPASRAFSQPGLAELLPRSGLEVERWLEDVGNFVACVARPTADETWKLLARGDRAHRQRHYSEALEAYTAVTNGENEALRAEGAVGCAVVLADLQKYERACEYLLNAAQSQPTDARPLAGLAEICLASGEPMEALQLAIRSLELDACYLPGARALAKAADALQQSDALTTWRLANSLSPGDMQSAIELARLSAARGDLSYAIWVMERARDFRGELGCDFHVTLAWLCLMADRVGEAQVEAEIARAQQPEAQGVQELWAHLRTLKVAS